MDRPADVPVVLLPIRPRYAIPIVCGEKKVEFRKTVFKMPPEYAVVYASSPVQKVMGYFSVAAIHVDSIGNLWRDYGEIGCIEREAFEDYYADSETGLVLVIGDVVTLPEPVALEALGLNSRPPQSFAYVSSTVIQDIGREASDVCRGPEIGRRSVWAGRLAYT